MPSSAGPAGPFVESLEDRRLLSFGQPDLRFGPNGSKTLADVYQPRVLLTNDDGVLVVGSSTADDVLTLEKFAANGAKDARFDGDGVATTPLLRTPTFALLQSDGKVLVFGDATATDVSSVVRFEASGAIDATFGNAGVAPTGLGPFGTTQDAAFASDGKLYVAGVHRDENGDAPTLGLARLNANGSRDATFRARDHIEEIAGYQRAGAWVTAGEQHIVPLPDGRVVLAAQVRAGIFASDVQFFYRFTAAGANDTTLDFTGAYRFDPTTGSDLVNAVAAQPDGSFVGAGVRDGLPVAWKFNASLGFDGAFGVGGQVDAPLGAGVIPREAIADSAGGAVVLGTGAGGATLVGRRLLMTSGATDNAFALDQTYARTTFPQSVSAGPKGTLAVGEFAYDDATSAYLAQRFEGYAKPATTPAPPLRVGFDNDFANEATGQMLFGFATVTSGQSIVKWEYDVDYDGTTFDADLTGQRPTFVADDGRDVARTVAVRVTDNFGQRVIAARSFTVRNVAPTATLTATGGAGKATATFANATDVSAADRAAGFRYSVDFNNDGDFTDAGEVAGATATTATFAYATAGTYTIHGRIADKDGGFTDYRANVTVTPPPATTPALLAGSPIGTPGGINGNTIAKAFDGSLATYVDVPTQTGAWVGLDLGGARQIASVRFAPRAGLARRMVGGTFQASNSATFTTGVVTLGTIAAQPAEGVLTTLAFAAPTAAYRYVRYLSPAGSFGNVAELQFFGTAGGTVTPPPSTGTLAKLTGTAIGTAGAINGNGFAKALDGDLVTYVDSTTTSGAWAGLDLGAARVVRQIRFAPRATLGRRMVGGYFQGSNAADFSVAATLFTIASAPPDGVLSVVDLTGTTAYRYVRYVAPANGFGNVAEVQFYG